MKNNATPLFLPVEPSIQPILEWLALAQGRTGADDAEQLLQQMRLLRAAPLPTVQRCKLLDLLFTHAERITEAQKPDLLQANLPISRHLRQRIRTTQNILETLTQDYLNTLSELFDPQDKQPSRAPEETLKRAILCIVRSIHISHLIASPTPTGLWLQLHDTFQTARKLKITEQTFPDEPCSLQQIYLGAILVAIAQPASFNAQEVELIADYLEHINSPIVLSETPPTDSNGLFWIDPKADVPAHAIVRRPPPSDTPVWFFSCTQLATEIKTKLDAIKNGRPLSQNNLPAQANTPAGKAALRRLSSLWGQPGKRKFPRRRNAYRTMLCSGLEALCQLLNAPDSPPKISEWMVINESPDGYALMHVSGHTEYLHVGDVVATQSLNEDDASEKNWQICMVRWAISENPEHIELGLQILASHAMAAIIAQPDALEKGTIPALILPETPPFRPSTAVIVHSGQLVENSGKLIVLLEKENLEIRELHTTHIDEQTSSIEVFSVEADATD